MTEGDDTGRPGGAERDASLAHALLLEAVDGVRQASHLVLDENASAALDTHADGLERLATTSRESTSEPARPLRRRPPADR